MNGHDDLQPLHLPRAQEQILRPSDLAVWRRGMAVVAGSPKSRDCGGVFLFTARAPGQRFERGVCPVPRRIEVAAIKRDQRARGFEDRVRLIRQRLTAGVRKSRCQPANRFELADQYGGRRRRRPDGSDRTRAWRGALAAPAASIPGAGCQCRTSSLRAAAARPA